MVTCGARCRAPTQRLQEPITLGLDDFLAEVKKSVGNKVRLTPAAVTSLRKAYEEIVLPARISYSEVRILERQISDLVNAAYGLTGEEVALMWRTAPPRMPQVGTP